MMAFASESPAKILEALIESLASPGLNSLAGNQIQRLLISKQLEQVFEDFQVNLQDLKCSGLLHRLCGLVSHKDIFVQHEASRVLLEALKYSGGPSGISELVSVPGFMQSLLDAVSSMVQVKHTAFDLAAQDTSLAADGSWIQTSSSNAAAVTLLWRMSDVERSKLLECSPSLAQILLGLLGSVSAGVRAAATGTLINLAVIPEVLGQLSQNKDLLPLLLGLLGKGAESQVNKPEDPAGGVSGFGSFTNVEVSTTAHTGNQYADSGGYNALAYTSVPGKDVKKAAGRPAGGSVSVSASWDLQQRSEYDVEQDVVVQMHASGLVSLLASCRESAEQLLISERALQRLIKGLSITSLLPRLIETNRQCRESCGRALLSLMVALPGPDTAEKVMGLLGSYIEARRDDLDAMILLSSNSGLRQALEHVMRRTVEEAGKMEMASGQALRVETEQLAQAGDSLASWVRPCQQALFTLHMLALKSSHSVAGLCCLDSDNQVKDSVSAGQHSLLLDDITQIALGTTRTQLHQTSLSKHGVTGDATSTAVSLVPDPLWFGLQTHACGVLALFAEHLVALGRSEVVSENLARSLFKLPDLAELLLASETATIPEIAVGSPTATSRSPDGIHKGFVAALMSVVCRHGPITSHAFTQVLLQAPGSLGAIMQLLAMSCLETSAQPPSPRLSPSQQRKHLLSQQQLLSPLSDDDFRTASTARPSSPLRGAQRMKQRKPSLRQLIIKVPINAGGQDIEDDDLPNLRSPTSVERSSPSSSRFSCDDKQHGAVVQKLSAAVGVVAASHLCTAAADSSSGVANVIATRF
ncbi:hypothetical protein CEUSTIGMA_g7197.t1 [Chlamydomonas eustigma]|uniref:Uncharacterized protein n=1 Tax=Chlamydomonas eustigma TaxID=1157962 RepID=A0A250X9N2_9CHLO|nr:hypothetical protein CEUSTIGMA_g7197.t1 [Chlamydomonas eustigma]|eukprot:GAX79756.1 hypothetical protein CEUSTIGMA_g7197.t1 [Chlamydomonas eustigma]